MLPKLVKSNFKDQKNSCKINSNEINHLVGNEKVVELLAKNGANIDSADENGRTALYFAITKGNTKW